MTYASDRGLKVGSKIRTLEDSTSFEKGSIITLVIDDGTSFPYFKNIKGDISAFHLTRKWEHYKEEDDKKLIKFPCCVPTSQIKDEGTFKKLVKLFVDNGSKDHHSNFEWVESYNYFGIDNDNDIVFYNRITSYSEHDSAGDVTIYTVDELLSLIKVEANPWIEWKGGDTAPSNLPKVFEVRFRDGDCEKSESPYGWRWDHYDEDRDIVAYRECKPLVKSKGTPSEVPKDPVYKVEDTPLLNVSANITYTINIKGVELVLTQEELDTVWLQLGVLTTYEKYVYE